MLSIVHIRNDSITPAHVGKVDIRTHFQVWAKQNKVKHGYEFLLIMHMSIKVQYVIITPCSRLVPDDVVLSRFSMDSYVQLP